MPLQVLTSASATATVSTTAAAAAAAAASSATRAAAAAAAVAVHSVLNHILYTAWFKAYCISFAIWLLREVIMTIGQTDVCISMSRIIFVISCVCGTVFF